MYRVGKLALFTFLNIRFAGRRQTLFADEFAKILLADNSRLSKENYRYFRALEEIRAHAPGPAMIRKIITQAIEDK